MTKQETYLFEYHHQGHDWMFEIAADSPADARERVNKLPHARYLGVLQFKVPARLGWVARAYCAVRNFCSSRGGTR